MVFRDPALARDVLFFIASRLEYHGGLPDAETFSILYPIFRGDFPKTLRKQALDLMELKDH